MFNYHDYELMYQIISRTNFYLTINYSEMCRYISHIVDAWNTKIALL